MKTSDIVVKTYIEQKIKPVGVAKVSIRYQDRRKKLKLYVGRKPGFKQFCLDSFRHINLNWPGKKELNHVKHTKLSPTV